tara:strand:- start:127 stop:237 length:111 start_codon:yes stop_codon:yes gene_type:complete
VFAILASIYAIAVTKIALAQKIANVKIALVVIQNIG